MPPPIWVREPDPEMATATVHASERLKISVPLFGDVAGGRAGGAAVAELQRAGGDGRAPVWVLVPVRVVAPFQPDQRAAAGNDASEGEDVGAVEDQCAIVGDVAGDGAGGAAVAELQGTGGDGRCRRCRCWRR